jgi:hypothetical protein
VEQEAADELARAEGHAADALAAIAAIVLDAEGDTPVVEGDQAAVGDGDTVGVAGEIGEDRLGPGEGGRSPALRALA